jgi:hypothetical protein
MKSFTFVFLCHNIQPNLLTYMLTSFFTILVFLPKPMLNSVYFDDFSIMNGSKHLNRLFSYIAAGVIIDERDRCTDKKSSKI